MIEASTQSDPLRRGTARKGPVPRTILSIAIAIGLAVLIAAALTYCVGQSSSPTAGARRGSGAQSGFGAGSRLPPVTVGVSVTVAGAIPIRIDALGTVTPIATVNVNSRVSGMLVSVNFREGQMVREGQLLAQIDPRPFQIAVDQAEAQLQHDQALLDDAKLDLARYRLLKTQDSIAGQQVDTQNALVKQEQAIVSADQATLANARLNLSFTRITAPVSGRVGLRQIDRGNQIAANASTPIVVVTQIDPMSVVFSVPEDDITAIMTSSNGGGGLAVDALDRTGGVVLAHGRLATLDNVIDTTTGTVKAKALFANGTGALFPDQFVNVSLLVKTLESQVVAPTTAVRHGPQGDFVWVLQPDHTVKVRPVTLGPGTPESVSIVSGLKVGETVVTDGGDRLRDGARVVLPGQRPPLGGPAGGHRHWHGGGSAGG